MIDKVVERIVEGTFDIKDYKEHYDPYDEL